MVYGTHLAFTSAALKAAGFRTKAKTHIFRGSGARMAELAGAEHSQIRRAGRWNNSSVEGAYLTHLPREVLRGLAGFNVKGRTFFLPRDIEVPEELQKAVFPALDGWLERYTNNDNCQQSLAAFGFMRLLKELRKVLLQDLAAIAASNGSHPLLSNALFERPDFSELKARMRVAINTAVGPAEQSLTAAAPQLMEYSRNAAEENRIHLNSLFERLTEKQDRNEEGIRNIQRSLARLFNGELAVRFYDPAAEGEPGQGQAQVARLDALNDVLASPSGSPPANVLVDAASLPLPTTYTMSRELVSVQDLWQEFKVGYRGGPSVEQMEATYGRAWRSDAKESKWYNRRKCIINRVQLYMETFGLEAEAAIARLQGVMQDEEISSLHALAGYIMKHPL